jgi:hypothetical protein
LDPNSGTKKLDPLLAMTAGTLAGASKYYKWGGMEKNLLGANRNLDALPY